VTTFEAYQKARSANPCALVCLRRGDFYEWYGDVARTVAAALVITLTGRTLDGVYVPMCGVPYHGVWRMFSELRALGHNVLVCDPQTGEVMADP
jgi:DNA mismatch repair protein MutS